MASEWQKLRDYFQQNANADIVPDSSDPHVFEDPRDKSKIMSINLLIRSGIAEEKLKETAQKIKSILDANNIAGAACVVKGAAHCGGIRILAEQPLPKSLGIRSQFDGVPVGLSIVESLEAFKKKAPVPKGPTT